MAYTYRGMTHTFYQKIYPLGLYDMFQFFIGHFPGTNDCRMTIQLSNLTGKAVHPIFFPLRERVIRSFLPVAPRIAFLPANHW